MAAPSSRCRDGDGAIDDSAAATCRSTSVSPSALVILILAPAALLLLTRVPATSGWAPPRSKRVGGRWKRKVASCEPFHRREGLPSFPGQYLGRVRRRSSGGDLPSLSTTAVKALSSQELKQKRRRRGSTATEGADAVPGVNNPASVGENGVDVAAAAVNSTGMYDEEEAKAEFDSLAESSGLVRLQRAAVKALEARAAAEQRDAGGPLGVGVGGLRKEGVPTPDWGGASLGLNVGGDAGLEAEKGEGSDNDDDDDEPPVGSLRRLNRAIDERLKSLDKKRREGEIVAAGGGAKLSSPLFDDGTSVAPPAVPVHDSMSSLLLYNHVQGDWSRHASSSTYNVAVVFGKRLVRDQITVEYASRIRTLARLFKEEPQFRPSLVCFCGPIGPGNHVSDADAGYIFFRHMCEAQGISLDGVSVCIDSKSDNEEEAIGRVADVMREDYLPGWLEASPAEVKTEDEFGRPGAKVRQKNVAVHFSLVSTEYHLCNLNDVHNRSPRQSLLKPIEALKDAMNEANTAPFGAFQGSATWSEYGSAMTNYYGGRAQARGGNPYYDDDDEEDDNEMPYPAYKQDPIPVKSGEAARRKAPVRGVVETSWSFQYATYPFLYAQDDAIAFLGKCFLLGEELTPLLVNMKGVVDQKEFFQRDNYLMLASIRRSLVSHVERLHSKRTALRLTLKEYSRNGTDQGRATATTTQDVVAALEGALLSLGRCVDLVRPAGLLVSSVSRGDWTRALRSLEKSMAEIRRSCDPDRPLRPTEWGKLVDDEAATLDIGADVRRPSRYKDIRWVIENMTEEDGGEARRAVLEGLDAEDGHGKDDELWMFGDE